MGPSLHNEAERPLRRRFFARASLPWEGLGHPRRMVDAPPADVDAALAEPNLRLRVGEHVVDVGTLRIVSRADAPRLTSKATAVLIELVRHAGNTVTRDALLDVVWKGRCPTPDVLTQAIKELRRAFCDDAKPSRYIETVPKVGYRLIASAQVLGNADPVAQASLREDVPLSESADEIPALALEQDEPRIGVWKWSLVACAIALLLAFVATREWREAAPRAAAMPVSAHAKWRAGNLRSITSDPGGEYRPTLSPDATRVAYSKANPDTNLQRLIVRSVEPSQSVYIAESPSQHSSSPMWSPDGGLIAFQRYTNDHCAVFVVQSLGGDEREVGSCENFFYNYFDWTPDGSGLITSDHIGKNNAALALMSWDLASGAKTALQYPRAPMDQDLEAHYSPDGRWLAFRRGLAPYSDLMLMPAGGGEVRQLTRLTSRIRGYTWTSDSTSLVFSAGQSGQFELYAVDLDGSAPQRLGVGPAEYPNAPRSGNLVVYEIPHTQNAIAEFTLGNGRSARTLAASTGNDSQVALSPDGRKIAFVSDRSGSLQVWVHDLATETSLPVTDFDGAALLSESWRPDSKALLATVRKGDASQLVEIDLASRRRVVLSKPGEHVLLGIYGVDAGDVLMLSGPSSRDDELVVVRNAGTPRESRSVLASNVEHVDVDTAPRLAYYTKTSANGLFKRGLDGGAEQFVFAGVNSVLMDGWRVVDGAIWYIRGLSIEPAELRKFDPADGSDVPLGQLDTELRDVRFAVAPTRDRVIVSKIRTEDIDVGAFTLDRASAD